MNIFRKIESGPSRGDEYWLSRLESEGEKTAEVVGEIREALSSAGFEEFNSLREANIGGQAIVRREAVDRVMHAVNDNEPYEITFDKSVPGVQNGGKYFNAALASGSDERGLIAAFTEGFSSKEGVALVVGIDPDNNLDVDFLEDNPMYFSIHEDQGGILDRTQNRAIEGTVYPENIRFIIMRAPLHVFPRELMTEAEETRMDVFENEYIKYKGDYSKLNVTEVTRIFVRNEALDYPDQALAAK